MKSAILNLLRKVHYSIPPELRNFYRIFIVFVQNIGYYIMPVRYYIINENDADRQFTFMHIGWDKRLCNYWLNRLSENYSALPGNRIISSWTIHRFLVKRPKEIDLAIVEEGKNVSLNNYPNSFLLPRWLEMELDFETCLKKERIKNITRNIKKHLLKYEIREGVESFDLFYHTMYKPFLIKRHGSSAEIAEYKHFLKKYQTEECVLFFIIKEGEPVASAFIEVKKTGYRLSTFGIKDGSEEIFKMGVIGALYYFVMLYYREKGANFMFLGKSMPIAFDGVTEFKMQIGSEPYSNEINNKPKFYFIPMNFKPPIIKILKSNPLFHLVNGHLHLASFINACDYESKEDFLKFFRRLKSKNVEKTEMYFFDSFEKIIPWLSKEELSNMEFCEPYRYK